MLDSDCWNSKESIRIIVCSKMRIFSPVYMDLSIGLSLKKCVLKFRTADIRFFLASKRVRIPSDWNSLTIIENTLSLSLRLYKSKIKQRFFFINKTYLHYPTKCFSAVCKFDVFTYKWFDHIQRPITWTKLLSCLLHVIYH